MGCTGSGVVVIIKTKLTRVFKMKPRAFRKQNWSLTEGLTGIKGTYFGE